MLTQATKDKIKSYGFDVDKLIEAVKAEAETEYEVPDFVAIKQSDLEARDANKIAEGKTLGAREGESSTIPTLRKELAKKLGIELKGDRIGDIASEIKTKLDATDNEKITELTTKNGLLARDKESLTSQLAEEQKRAKQAVFDSELITYFPANRNADLTDGERLALVKMNLSFDEMDGKKVVKRNGEILRDKNSQNPLELKQVIGDLFTEKNWVSAGGQQQQQQQQGGRGGGDSTPKGGSASGIKSLTQFQDNWTKANPQGNPLSPEFTEALNAHAKDVPDFDFYN